MLTAIYYVVIYLLIVGMACGWLAWVVMGKSKALKRADKKPNWAIIFPLGVAGSFIGGLGVSLLAGNGFALKPSGMIASFIGALIAVWIYMMIQDRSK